LPKTSYLCKRQEKPKAKINNRETTSKTIVKRQAKQSQSKEIKKQSRCKEAKTIAKERNKKTITK